MSHRVLILACSAAKLDSPAPAHEFYQGNIFKKGLEYGKREGLWVMILSAKYGLINWDHPCSPYNEKRTTPYRGPWPAMPGYYLGGSLYFGLAPRTIEPLVPSGTIGFMLRDLNRLLRGEPREALFAKSP